MSKALPRFLAVCNYCAWVLPPRGRAITTRSFLGAYQHAKKGAQTGRSVTKPALEWEVDCLELKTGKN